MRFATNLKIVLCRVCMAWCLSIIVSSGSWAAVLLGPADAGRIGEREENQQPTLPLVTAPLEKPREMSPPGQAPEGSERTTIHVRSVSILGTRVFSKAELHDLYAAYLDHDITANKVWTLAEQVTEKYRKAGYFLSRAYVPQQDMKNGNILLRVVEGFIGEVRCDDALAKNHLIKQGTDKLLSFRPLKADQIENVLLLLNDLPGVSLQAIMEEMPSGTGAEGAVRLVLKNRPEPRVTGSVGVDNLGSRFLGPYEGQAQTQVVVFPNQRTTLNVFSSLPWNEVKYGSLKHEATLVPGGTLTVYGSRTAAAPGYTLKPEEIKSRSTAVGTAFEYSFIRQRDENVRGRVALEGRDTSSDTLGSPLTRDRVRTASIGMSYQNADRFSGQNFASATVTQGLPVLGSNRPGQLNLSRADARPDFTKMGLKASRVQALPNTWEVSTAVAAQVASGTLYSSEQFGHGGQAFGRAYDDSEIMGDHGVAFSAEVRYGGAPAWGGFLLIPYGFYDRGTVWNTASTAQKSESGSSAGVGFRVASDYGVSGSFGLAFPLTRRITTPVYGNGENPRYFFQIEHQF